MNTIATALRTRKAKRCLDILEEMQYGKKKVTLDAEKPGKMDQH